MSPEELREIARRATWNYRDHPDRDDLLQEAWIAAWQQCERQPEAPELAVAWNAARWGAAEYLRRLIGLRNLAPARPKEPLSPESRTLSLADLDPDEEPGALEPGYAAVEDALAPRVSWQGLQAVCTPRQWEAVRWRLGAGLTLVATARQMGTSRGGVERLVREGLKAYRLALGEPEPGPQRAGAGATHCCRGHARTPANLRVDPKSGLRQCRICHRDNERRRRERTAR